MKQTISFNLGGDDIVKMLVDHETKTVESLYVKQNPISDDILPANQRSYAGIEENLDSMIVPKASLKRQMERIENEGFYFPGQISLHIVVSTIK